MGAMAALEPDVYDSDAVLSFADILAGKAGPREAEAARAWANGEIKAPPMPDYLTPVEPDGDARTSKKRKRVESEASDDGPSGASEDHERQQQSTADGAVEPEDVKPPPPPAPVYEPIQALGTKASLDPAPSADLPLRPPKPSSSSKPASEQAALARVDSGGSGHTRVRPHKPVPDAFTVLTKIDSSGKIRKTFVTPDQKRWYTLKEAVAHWEALGNELTYNHPQPVDDTPPVATIPRGAAASTPAGPASTSAPAGGDAPRRPARLPVPDQFTVTSKLDVNNKERKTWHTPDGRKWGTFKEAAAHWEGLGHTLTYTNHQAGQPPTPPPTIDTTPPPAPPPAPAPAPTPAPAPGPTPPLPSTVKSGGEPSRRGPAPLPVPDQFSITIKTNPAGKDRKTWHTPDGRKWGTFKEAAAHWEGLGHTLTYSKLPPPSTTTPPATNVHKVESSGRRGPAPIPVPDQFTVDVRINGVGKERKTWGTPDGRKWGTFKEARAHWEGLGHTLTYTKLQRSPAAAAASPATATPASAGASSAGAGRSSSDAEDDGGDEDEEGADSGTEGGSSEEDGAARGGSGGKGRGTPNVDKWLPPGWKSELKTRMRNNRTTGDWYYTSPSGVVYRSYVAAQQAFQNDVQGPPLEDLADLPGILRALARRDTVAPHSGLAAALERVRQLRAKKA